MWRFVSAAVATALAAAAVLTVQARTTEPPGLPERVVAVADRRADLTGRVVAVADGDTLTLLTPDRRQVRVRLDEIDAPERGQPWGANAKQALGDLVYARDVQVAVSGTDRYGRTLGRVTARGVDVNARLVEDGDAWAYRAYLKDPRLARLEGEARRGRRGLWTLPPDQATPPWSWRVAQRNTPAAPRPQPAPSAETPRVVCGAKRYCKQMTSCAEARAYLLQCKLKSLDADGDGVPCETLCRAT